MLSIGHIICLEKIPLSPADAHEKKRRRADSEDGDVITVEKLDEEHLRSALQTYVHEQVAHGTPAAACVANNTVEVRCTRSEEGRVFSFSLVPHALLYVEEEEGKEHVPLPLEWGMKRFSQLKASSGLSLSDTAWSQLVQLRLPHCVKVKDTQTTHAIMTQSFAVAPANQSGTAVAVPNSTALFAYDWKSTAHESAVYHAPLLLIGVGGIGCEVLKILVLSGFKNLHILDLDTIDATNLNRQFLFTNDDVGKSKAEAARRTVLSWFRQRDDAASAAPTIVSLHDNIKDAKFDDAFYRQFAVVLNALDNVSARQQVNFMCMKTGTPLIESGSMGFNGQVQPIVKHISECYHCRPKPPDKQSFAVCTIHARPTTMVHCVHYAKELYESLFGEQQEELLYGQQQPQQQQQQQQQDGAVASSSAPSAPTELSYLRRVALDFHERWSQQDTLEPSARSELLYEFAVELLEHLFHHKIQELLDMKSAWSTAPPVPIAIADIRRAATAVGADSADGASAHRGICSAAFVQQMVADKPTTPLSIQQCIQLFVFTVSECAAREAKGFQKEDDSGVRFVAAVSNLRAHVYGLAMQPVEEIRTIAGAIVPAVATTNAMVAAGVVQQLYVALRMRASAADGVASTAQQDFAGHLQMIYVRKAPQERREKVRNFFSFQRRMGDHAERSNERTISVRSQIHTAPLSSPNPFCVVCQDLSPTVSVALPRASARTYTLRDLIDHVVVGQLGMEGPCVFLHSKIIFEEEDYETLAVNTLLSFATVADGQQQRVATGHLPLLFVVDAINHEVEWQLEVSFTASDDTAVVTGVEEANKTELRSIHVKQLKERGGDGERNAAESVSVSAVHPSLPSGPTDGAGVIDIDDDEDDDNVIEVD